MIVYIAGPMSGIKDFNFPAFDKARNELISKGYQVNSPADLNRVNRLDCIGMSGHESLSELGVNLIEIIERNIDAVLKSDAILLLPGWHKSKGATAELSVANWAGKKVFINMPSKINQPTRD